MDSFALTILRLLLLEIYVSGIVIVDGVQLLLRPAAMGQVIGQVPVAVLGGCKGRVGAPQEFFYAKAGRGLAEQDTVRDCTAMKDYSAEGTECITARNQHMPGYGRQTPNAAVCRNESWHTAAFYMISV